MKKIQAPIQWVVLLGIITYIAVNAFVVVEKNYTYVENEVLFSEFKLTKEYKSKLEKIKKERQAILDSMEIAIRQDQTTLNEDSDEKAIVDYKRKLQEYSELSARFEEQNEILANQYDQIIWKQLNSYIKEYGEQHKAEIVLGVSGTGNIMYANEALNTTAEVLEFINMKYEGH